MPKTKHGQCPRRKKTKLYSLWQTMKCRCHCPTHVAYLEYGGRGIVVCHRWRNSFEAFVQDIGPRPSPKHSLDRYPNPNGSYEPGNVRWATPGEQARNRKSNRVYTHAGKTQCLMDWSLEVGVNYHTIVGRLDRGWPFEEAISKTKRKPGRRARLP